MTLTYAYLEYTANSVNSIVVSVGRELLPSHFWAFLGEENGIQKLEIWLIHSEFLRSGLCYFAQPKTSIITERKPFNYNENHSSYSARKKHEIR